MSECQEKREKTLSFLPTSAKIVDTSLGHYDVIDNQSALRKVPPGPPRGKLFSGQFLMKLH